MKRLVLAAVAVLSLSACATSGNPDYTAYTNAQIAISANQSAAEATRLHALAAVAAGGDDRVKDRAIAELSRGTNVAGAGAVQAPQAQPNLLLEVARVFVPSLVQVYGITANAKVAVDGNATSVALHGQTMGTLGTIAGQGLTTAGSLGEAGIAKIITP